MLQELFKPNYHTRVFDYRLIRLLVGLIALLLPPLVIVLSHVNLPSISASYYTAGRDWFVGSLFIVAAFLFAYNGRGVIEMIVSKLAGVAAALVALNPTSCPCMPLIHCICGEGADTARIHYISAIVLFVSLAFFLWRFALRARSKARPGRAIIYWLCFTAISAALIVGLIGTWVLSPDEIKGLRLIFYVECVALWAFAIGWIVAGTYRKDEDPQGST